MKTRIAVTVLALFVMALLGACQQVDGGILVRTADPALSLFVPVPAGPLAPVEPAVVPSEEVGESLPDPTPAPPCEVIKGNIARNGEKIFHAPGQANYETVKIDEAAGEQFFCSEDEAIAAGFRKALR